MSQVRASSVESDVSVLSCTSSEYQELFNGSYSTDILSDDAINIIKKCETRLRNESNRYRLHDLLYAMLTHAPHPEGRRYVSIALHVAYKKGEDSVVDLAKAWLDNLYLPMLTISNRIKTEPSTSQTPTVDNTLTVIEPATRTKDFRQHLAEREQHRCAITKTIDVNYTNSLINMQRDNEIPTDIVQREMEGAHIIPLMLNSFPDTPNISREEREAARTWDMLQSWTRIDLRTLVGERINSPENGIFMTADEHSRFGKFQFYFDKEAFLASPNRYFVRMSHNKRQLSNGHRTAIVEFRSREESGFEPPNAEFLKVHAAFAKVLHLSGAAEYFGSLEREVERNAPLRLNREADFASLLRVKLAIMAK